MECASTYHFILKVLGGSKTIVMEISGVVSPILTLITVYLAIRKASREDKKETK